MSDSTTIRRVWVAAAVAFLAAAIPLGIVWTLSCRARVARLESASATAPAGTSEGRLAAAKIAQDRKNVGFGWADVAAAAVGIGLLAYAGTNRRGAPWAAMAAAAPLAYLLLSAAPMVVTREVLPVLRLAAAAGAAGAYLGVVRPIPGRLQYGVCCAAMGTLALFFGLWEAPLPRPMPIRKPLSTLEAAVLRVLPGWTGRHQPLPEAVEKVLGADHYLNLELKPPPDDPAAGCGVTIFVTYDANAMSKIPHVPWVCMVQSGFRIAAQRHDELPGSRITPNVILFDPPEGAGRTQALVIHYFRVGDEYTWNREWTRLLATSGSLTGSFLSQTQIVVYFEPREGEDPMAKDSRPLRVGLDLLNKVAPLLEKDYYPSLGETEGG